MSASTKLEYVMYRLLRKTLTKIDLNTGTEFKSGVRGANSHNDELLDILKLFCFRSTLSLFSRWLWNSYTLTCFMETLKS